MTITIGQYLPGQSLLHRADPRTKILLTLVYMVVIIAIDSFISYAVAAVLLILALISSKISFRLALKSLRPILFLIIFMAVLNLFFYRGTTLLISWKFIKIYKESIFICLKMIVRIILLVLGASMLTYTTTSVMLTDGLEKLMSPLKIVHFPAHDIAMMMSIALRFIPTFAEETERIMKAQKARGSETDTKKLFDKIKSFIPILVPLFISAFRRADELATAMSARCYRGGSGRTRFRELHFTYVDAILCIIIVSFSIIVAVLEYFL